MWVTLYTADSYCIKSGMSEEQVMLKLEMHLYGLNLLLQIKIADYYLKL